MTAGGSGHARGGTMAMESVKTIAVIGATGVQGGGVVRALQERGKIKVRALTRNPNAAAGLADEVVTADLTRPETVSGTCLRTSKTTRISDPMQTRRSLVPRRYRRSRSPTSRHGQRPACPPPAEPPTGRPHPVWRHAAPTDPARLPQGWSATRDRMVGCWVTTGTWNE